MPVNTAVTLLPATPTRLQFGSSSSDGGPDSTSFQDTLQRASASQDDSSSSPSAQDTLAPAKKADTSKTKSAGDTRGAQRTKAKKLKHAEADAAEETAEVDGESDRPVEATKDATDQQDKHSEAKDKDKNAPAQVAAAASSTSLAAAAQQATPAVHGDAEAAEETAAGHASKAQANPAAATVKKAAGDKADETDADADRADAADDGDKDTEQADAAQATAKPAVANFGVTTGAAAAKSAKKSSGSEATSSNTATASATGAAAATAAVESTAAVATLLSHDESAGEARAASPMAAVDPSAAPVPAVAGRSPGAAKVAAAAADPADKALATSDAQFAETNHPQIVTAVHGQLLPNGGNMQIRLDPAELGTLQINVQVKNGAMTATFETSNSEATRQLSHSLGDLRNVLEQAGVTVDKIHVQQSAKPDGRSSSGEDGQKQGQSEQNPQAKQEQQRRELLQRMWKKLSGGDPLDLTA